MHIGIARKEGLQAITECLTRQKASPSQVGWHDSERRPFLAGREGLLKPSSCRWPVFFSGTKSRAHGRSV